MSYNNSGFISASALQAMLTSEQFIRDNPVNKTGHLGTLRTIMDPLNTRGYLQNRIDVKNGTKREVELVYTPRISENDVLVGSRPNCQGGTVYGETSETYSLADTDLIRIPFNIPIIDLANREQDLDSYVAEQFLRAIRSLTRKLNSEAVAALGVLKGNFADGVTGPVSVAVRSGSVYLPDPAVKIGMEYDKAEGRDNGTPIVLGGGYIAEWFRAKEAACCASTNVLLDEYVDNVPMIHVYDPTIEKVLGGQNFMVLSPGAVQMLTWNQFKGSNAARIDVQSYQFGTIIDPVTGIECDYTAIFDCGVWKCDVSIYRKFVALPDDVFRLGDDLRGVNYIMPFVATAS